MAARDIGEEEEVTISYVDPEKNTFQRRRILRETHGESLLCFFLNPKPLFLNPKPYTLYPPFFFVRFVLVNMYRVVLYIYILLYVYTYVYIYTYACMCVCVYIYIQVYICKYMCVYISRYIYIYICMYIFAGARGRPTRFRV